MAEERTISFAESLAVGLHPQALPPRNAPFLEQAYNVRCSELERVRSPRAIVDPVAAGSTVAWPFPQLFRTKTQLLKAAETVLYTINETNDTQTAIVPKQFASVATNFTIPSGGGSWHIAEFDKVWLLSNTAATLLYSPAADWTVVGQSATQVGTVCSLDGVLFMAGFDGSDAHYATSFWAEIWNLWLEYAPPSAHTHEGMALDSSTVFWSRVREGAADWPLTVEMAMFGFLGATKRDAAKMDVRDAIQKGEMGFIVCPFAGSVLRLLPMENRVMLYGSQGVAALMPVERRFEAVQALGIGIASRSAVGGKSEHRMVASTGQIWRLAADEIAPEDFRWFGLADDDSEVLVLFDERDGEYYLGTDERCLLKSGGWSELPYAPTGLAQNPTELLGFKAVFEADASVRLRTTAFDCGLGSMLKAVRNVGASAINYDSLQFNFLALDEDGLWTTSDDMLALNGWANVGLAGQQFKLELEIQPTTDFQLDQLDVRWVLVGKQQIRGMY